MLDDDGREGGRYWCWGWKTVNGDLDVVIDEVYSEDDDPNPGLRPKLLDRLLDKLFVLLEEWYSLTWLS